MKKNMIRFAVAAAFAAVSVSANADDGYNGAWYVVPGASYVNTDSDLEADNGGGGFIRLGKELSEHWDLQLGVGHNRASEDLSRSDIAALGGTSASGRFKQTSLGLDALYMFSRDKLRPFLLAGLGAARNDVDYKVKGNPLGNIDVGDDKTSWMANVGLGLQYLFTDNVGLQADLRQVWSRAKAEGRVGGVEIGSDNETIGNTLFNLGGIIRFAAPKPVAVPEPEPAPVAEPAPAPAPEPAPAPAPEPVKCQPTMETITISAEKLFTFDKSNIKDEGKAALDEAAAKINANPDINLVYVTGHTDYLGSDAYNQKLSQRRADQVKAYLVTQGVAESRLEAIGKGESEPVVNCDGVKGRKKLIECLQPNRRVDLHAETKRETGCN